MTTKITLTTLKKRSDFVRLSKSGKKFILPTMVILYQPQTEPIGQVRVGFTVTKKIGNAVVRNRIKRRLRMAVREMLPELAEANTDYVLIARHTILGTPYAKLTDGLQFAFSKMHRRKQLHSNDK